MHRIFFSIFINIKRMITSNRQQDKKKVQILDKNQYVYHNICFATFSIMKYSKQTQFYVRKYQSYDCQEVQEIFYNGTSGIFMTAVLNLWNGENFGTLIFHFSFFIFCLVLTTWNSWIVGASLFATFESLVIFAVYDIFYNRAR